MKTKEYINQFNISKGWNPKVQKEFLNELTSEFLAICEVTNTYDNIRRFEHAVSMIHMKWNAISNKIPFGLPENLWSFFYATVIVKLREELCPTEMKRKRDKAAARKAEYKSRQERIKEQERKFQERWEEYQRSFYERLTTNLLNLIDSVPLTSFNYFGLNHNTATKDLIMTKYRELAVKLHPDRGGNQEDFIQLIEHKNKCIQYINSKS